MIGIIVLISCVIAFFLFEKYRKRKQPKAPETEKWWTILYYGDRGAAKTLHQARVVKQLLEWLTWLYKKNPKLKRAIVYSIQKFSPDMEYKYAGMLYYWREAKDLRYCPRVNCWRVIPRRHRLHGAYIIMDDIASMFPAKNWHRTPTWLIKTFSQARKNGIRVLANCQDPFSVDINFRRYVDMCFRFSKVISSRDPDETKPAVKLIFGLYLRRKIKAKLLWEFGNMNDLQITEYVAQKQQEDKVNKTNIFKDVWKASWWTFGKSITDIYDTTQDIPEYQPVGYEHSELGCIDPEHNHVDKKAPNYCGFKKVDHELV